MLTANTLHAQLSCDVAGDVDVHYAISYFWLAGDNDTSNAAFAQSQIDMLNPYVISTQVAGKLEKAFCCMLPVSLCMACWAVTHML